MRHYTPRAPKVSVPDRKVVRTPTSAASTLLSMHGPLVWEGAGAQSPVPDPIETWDRPPRHESRVTSHESRVTNHESPVVSNHPFGGQCRTPCSDVYDQGVMNRGGIGKSGKVGTFRTCRSGLALHGYTLLAALLL